MLGLNWCASVAERKAPLPSDELLPGARTRCDRAISIDASLPLVFRWLCQLRIAPYSYDVLDNLGQRSPRQLIPGLERLQVGQRFMRIFTLALLRTRSTRSITFSMWARPTRDGSGQSR